MNPPPQLLSPSAWTVPRLEGGDGLFAVVLGTWGLGAVTPVHPYPSAASRFPKTWPKARGPRRTTRDLSSKS
ncbi:hypothetical protein N9O21_04125 [Rhodobacteraceae bacterium]|nr:hypothetical protein [Paracoccaceae bacterium]